ncbi:MULTISPECIES: hypothetical protein [unclassified Mesobacillus]|uniref:hypothetical protein n=1 Tax=unclassified Mesobacillus TaxID=2675270 RepID=UPI00204131C4|nr:MULTISPECIES: hypothetical protein [unclassified Mesobacillus]MCM3126035.1 hypothetical protein [Mesobacillus sp. MER 33]MCM3236021.1 hypothetical protein [Mesobacillus sp. MER 48]
MVGGFALVAILGLCILLMYWGYKRVVEGLTELLNRKETKLENEIQSLNSRLKKIEENER